MGQRFGFSSLALARQGVYGRLFADDGIDRRREIDNLADGEVLGRTICDFGDVIR